MTREETINKLDSLITQLNGFLVRSKDLRNIKHNVVMVLNEIPASTATINSIARMDIKDYSRNNDLARQYYGDKEYKKMAQEDYKATIESMISILRQEREAQVQAMQNEAQKLAFEEQKRGNQIQKNALYVSIVAIIISLASMIVAICK